MSNPLLAAIIPNTQNLLNEEKRLRKKVIGYESKGQLELAKVARVKLASVRKQLGKDANGVPMRRSVKPKTNVAPRPSTYNSPPIRRRELPLIFSIPQEYMDAMRDSGKGPDSTRRLAAATARFWGMPAELLASGMSDATDFIGQKALGERHGWFNERSADDPGKKIQNYVAGAVTSANPIGGALATASLVGNFIADPEGTWGEVKKSYSTAFNPKAPLEDRILSGATWVATLLGLGTGVTKGANAINRVRLLRTLKSEGGWSAQGAEHIVRAGEAMRRGEIAKSRSGLKRTIETIKSDLDYRRRLETARSIGGDSARNPEDSPHPSAGASDAYYRARVGADGLRGVRKGLKQEFSKLPEAEVNPKEFGKAIGDTTYLKPHLQSPEAFAKWSITTKNDTRLMLGKLRAIGARKVKDLTGIDIQGAEIRIDSQKVRHAIKRHGNETGGQVSITPRDFSLIEEILQNPDSVDYHRKNGKIVMQNGHPELLFIKRIGTKYHVGVVAFKQSGEKPMGQLQFSTMWIKK